MPQWKIDSARLSVFAAPDFAVAPALWRECVGDDPETSIFQRATGTKVEIGPFAEGKLTLQTQPMRVDWVHEPAATPAEPDAPDLGPFPSAAGPLLELGRRWARSNSFPDTPRVALGLVLASPTGGRASGYRELSDFVDGAPTNPEARDFLYQINIPRDSQAGVDGLRVNRLSKWSVALLRRLVVTPASAKQQFIGPDLHFLRLELDISTDSDFGGLIPRDKVAAIIDDLLDGAKEIIERGAHVK